MQRLEARAYELPNSIPLANFEWGTPRIRWFYVIHSRTKTNCFWISKEKLLSMAWIVFTCEISFTASHAKDWKKLIGRPANERIIYYLCKTPVCCLAGRTGSHRRQCLRARSERSKPENRLRARRVLNFCGFAAMPMPLAWQSVLLTFKWAFAISHCACIAKWCKFPGCHSFLSCKAAFPSDRRRISVVYSSSLKLKRAQNAQNHKALLTEPSLFSTVPLSLMCNEKGYFSIRLLD